ncbi:TVP38/TMEM64 family protein [Pseudonocardia sp.]|uniref:TVP38/TMEM64 family protein n=1 Tax=Pseudonocardia sp. TaxID=60912 RepID=UPI003D144B62
MVEHDAAGAEPGQPDRGVTSEVRSVGRAMWVRLAVLAVFVAAGVVVAVVVGLPDVESLRAGIAAAGPAAPVLFVLLYAVATLAPLPKNVLSTVAGVLFGLVPGVALVLLAALLGAAGAFGLGRLLGRGAVERFTGARVARVDELLRRRGLLTVIGVRLVPVVPFTAVNYAAGLTAVRIRDYALGTALGIIPGTIAFVALGAYGTSPGSWPFVVAVVALVGLTAGGAVVARRSRRRGAVGPGPGAT